MQPAIRRAAIAFSIIMTALFIAPPSGLAQDPAMRLQFSTVEKYAYSGEREKKNYVVTTREEWESLWDLVYMNRSPRPALPEVDFTRRIIVAVFMGEQVSSGHHIEITGLARKGKKLTAFVKERSPASECGTLAVITQPYHIIETKKARKVSFEVEQEIVPCR